MDFIAFIAEDPPEWADDPAAFVAAFSERWPQAAARIDEDGWVRIELPAVDEDGTVSAHLQPNAQALSIDVVPEAAVELACWWRERVPAEVPMTFCDEGYEGAVPIEPGATPGDLLRRHEAAP